MLKRISLQNRRTKRQRKTRLGMTAAAAMLTVALLTACSDTTGSAVSETKATAATEVSDGEGSTVAVVTGDTISVLDTSGLFTERDLDSSYDEADAETITLSDAKTTSSSKGVSVDGQTVTITEEGVYVLTGSLSDGQLVVDCEDEEAKVQLVLDGVTIANDSSACIYVKNADKVFVTSKAGSENTLSVTGDFAAIDDNNIDGAIFAKSNLTLNGTGSLAITTANGHGVVSKDNLRICEDGDYTITAANGHGLQGKDSVRIAGGTITITSGTDGIHSENDDDAAKGFVYIADGTVTIAAGDDGIHADNETYIDGGTITVRESYEGIEGSIITINGGTIDVTASDDGFNATGQSEDRSTSDFGPNMDNNASAALYINGGTVNVNASGDGLDSNGSLTINGGTVYVSGPTSDGDGALDSGGETTINGGTVVAAGSSGMAESFGSASTQPSMIVYLNGTQTGAISLADADGTVLVSFTPAKQYSSVVISTPELTGDGTYTLTAGSETQEITMDGMTYGESRGMGSFGGRGGMGGRGGFGGEESDGGTPPDRSGDFGEDGGTPPDGNGAFGGDGSTPPEGGFGGGNPPDGSFGGRGGGGPRGNGGGMPQDGQPEDSEAGEAL